MATLPPTDDLTVLPAPPESRPPSESRPRTGVLQGILVFGGLVALILLLVEVRPVLGPFWAAAAGAVLLWPIRRRRAVRAVLMAGGLVLAAYVLSQLGDVLAPFAVVFVVAYILDPVVTWTGERWGWPRWLPTALLTLAVIGLLSAVLLLLVPMLVEQVQVLAESAIELALHLPTWAARSEVLASMEEAGVLDRDALVGELATILPRQIEAAVGQIPEFVAGLTRQVGLLIGLITTTALIPVLLFYTLKDFPRLRDSAISLMPRYQGKREYVERVGHVFGSYVRGQLTISILSAVLVSVPLLVLGVPFSLLLGVAAGLLNMIPSLGSILTYVLGVVLMLAFGTTGDLVTVLIVLVVQALIEQTLLTPNIMSQQVGLHPVVILLALFVSGALFGLIGLVLAVPGAALLAGSIRAYREAFVLDLDAPDSGIVVPE